MNFHGIGIVVGATQGSNPMNTISGIGFLVGGAAEGANPMNSLAPALDGRGASPLETLRDMFEMSVELMEEMMGAQRGGRGRRSRNGHCCCHHPRPGRQQPGREPLVKRAEGLGREIATLMAQRAQYAAKGDAANLAATNALIAKDQMQFAMALHGRDS